MNKCYGHSPMREQLGRCSWNRLPIPYPTYLQNHTIEMESYHRGGIIPYHGNGIIPWEWNHSIGIIPWRWDHTKYMESYHTIQRFAYNIHMLKHVYSRKQPHEIYM